MARENQSRIKYRTIHGMFNSWELAVACRALASARQKPSDYDTERILHQDICTPGVVSQLHDSIGVVAGWTAHRLAVKHSKKAFKVVQTCEEEGRKWSMSAWKKGHWEMLSYSKPVREFCEVLYKAQTDVSKFKLKHENSKMFQ